MAFDMTIPSHKQDLHRPEGHP